MDDADGFFAEAANDKPFFKAAFQGFAGSGKTYTAALIAIGIHERIASTKPVVFFDTEKAAKFLKPTFAESGVELRVRDSRTMADLAKTMELCRGGYTDVLIIDSISHVWEDFLASYKRKVRRDRLEFQDWGVLKPTWKSSFSDPFVRDPYHAIFCGRAGYEYENELDDRGKRQIYKSGVKMKVEGETAYEPDILVLMERFEELLVKDKRVWREATVIKDRSTLIDGKTFENPTFDDFAPAIDAIVADAVDRPPVAEGDSAALFKTEDDKRAWLRRRDIVLERIQGDLVIAWPGQDKDAKRHKADALRVVFGTTSWKDVERRSPELLEDCFGRLGAYILEHAKDLPEDFAASLAKRVDVDDDDLPEGFGALSSNPDSDIPQ